MTSIWNNLLGHDEVLRAFRLAVARKRLASTFLFVGPSGIGKRTFALKLAQSLLCDSASSPTQSAAELTEELQACGQCDACVQLRSGFHPDLLFVTRPPDKRVIPIDLLIGDADHRMQQGLCHEIGLKPFSASRRIAIIDDADALNEEGANCLLKTLEEPPPRSVFILIGTSADKQLPTIRSRCQIVRFRPLEIELVERLLLQQELVDTPEDAKRLAAFSSGSIEQALRLGDPELWKFRQDTFDLLATKMPDGVRLSQTIQKFIDSAGKEASLRRERLRILIGFTIDFHQQVIRTLVGADTGTDLELNRAAQNAVDAGFHDIDTAGACIDRCAAALEQVNRNVHLSTLIDSWIDDLARMRITGVVLPSLRDS